MTLTIPPDLILITVVLSGFIGWKFRGDRPFLWRNWSHVVGALFAYFLLFYALLLVSNRVPLILRGDWMWAVAHLLVLVGGIGGVLGFLLQRFFSRRKGGK